MAIVSAATSSSCGALSTSNLIRADYGVLSRSSHEGLRRAPLYLLVKPAVSFSNGYGRLYTYQQGQQRWRNISCGGTWPGSNFENQAGRMADEVRRKASDAAKAVSSGAEELLNNAKRTAGEFSKKSDLRGRANRAAQTATRKFEEFGYDAKRTAARWDREYRISEKVQEARDFATEQIQNADRQLGVRQKARNFSSDFRLKWPTYRRQFSNFLDTPVGRSFVTLFVVWLVFSGWLFRILLLSMWIFPLAAPLLLSTLSKAAVVEGSCPNCGQRYIGGRSQSVMCARCKGVVWQPRQDFSKDKSDPRIIDIDINPQ